MKRLFKNELVGCPFRSFVMVDMTTNMCTLYREYKESGRIVIITEADLVKIGWLNAEAFIANGAGNRIEVSYEAQKMNEHVNYISMACALRIQIKIAKDEFTKKSIAKEIEKLCTNASFFGLSPSLVEAFCVGYSPSIYEQEVQHGFRTAENYRRRGGNIAGSRKSESIGRRI